MTPCNLSGPTHNDLRGQWLDGALLALPAGAKGKLSRCRFPILITSLRDVPGQATDYVKLKKSCACAE